MGLRRAGDEDPGSSATVGSGERIPRLQPRPSVPTGSGPPTRPRADPLSAGLCKTRRSVRSPVRPLPRSR